MDQGACEHAWTFLETVYWDSFSVPGGSVRPRVYGDLYACPHCSTTRVEKRREAGIDQPTTLGALPL